MFNKACNAVTLARRNARNSTTGRAGALDTETVKAFVFKCAVEPWLVLAPSIPTIEWLPTGIAFGVSETESGKEKYYSFLFKKKKTLASVCHE